MRPSVYVYQRGGDGWAEVAEVAELTAPEPGDRDPFGHAAALAGEVALVDAPRDDDPQRDAGTVWRYVAGADGWSSADRLSPAAPEAYDEVGSALAADGPVAIVGTPNDVPAGSSHDRVTGTATLFLDGRYGPRRAGRRAMTASSQVR